MSQKTLTIIGAGPGGYEAALYAAQKGLKVTLIEEKDVGGTCLNRGCIPTKALLHAAHIYKEAKEGEDMGIISKSLGFDEKAAINRKNYIVATLREGIEKHLLEKKVELIRGKGAILAKNKVQITKINGEISIIQSDNIIIATGSKPLVPNIEGLAGVGAMTSDELLSYDGKIDSITIIGGGVIGIEFAGLYNALGAQVTIIEAMDRVLPTLDKELSQSISMSLKKRGVKIITGTRVQKTTKQNDKIIAHFTIKDKEECEISQHLLVAIGRSPNTAEVITGEIECERGFVKVDKNYMTSLDGVYAIGDIVFGGIQLAHVASAQGFVAVDSIMGNPPSINTALVPSCIFTFPEIATVGMSADEAKSIGLNVKIAKYLMGSNGKTAIATSERGFIKILARERDNIIIGAQLFCVNATDMINELSLAIACEMTADKITSVIHPHPTFGEAVRETALKL